MARRRIGRMLPVRDELQSPKAWLRQVWPNEGDGTRTRNHRIDNRALAYAQTLCRSWINVEIGLRTPAACFLYFTAFLHGFYVISDHVRVALAWFVLPSREEVPPAKATPLPCSGRL